MEQIRDRVVGLTVYQHIFKENHILDHQIQSHIVAAYDNFIRFCIAATEYYTQRGFSMLQLALYVNYLWNVLGVLVLDKG